ncbi:MAG: biotin--[acetyl-CoA-carboxylase] ligase [Rickettsiales bacterium]|nr:biotin--[acetyl-CoA-carboxylase] ligase [Rickettsiales bacterium]
MFKIYFFNEVTSTMDLIKSYPVNTAIIAKKQTKGRGKQNRVWVSDESENLYMSLSIDVDKRMDNYANFIFLTTLAMVKTIEKLTDERINIKIKWPNDILVNNKKVCGILMEIDQQNNILIIGIGLNIDKHPELAGNALFRATNLEAEGLLVKKDAIVSEFLKNFEFYTEKFDAHSFISIRDEWLTYAYNLGKTIKVKIDSDEMSGIFDGIDLDGSLILDKNDEKFYISSGDIF